MKSKAYVEETIFIIEENCQGVTNALEIVRCLAPTISYLINGETKVKVNPAMCIQCGKCIEVCDHKARDFRDDTKRSFHDLQQGQKITVLVAPRCGPTFRVQTGNRVLEKVRGADGL